MLTSQHHLKRPVTPATLPLCGWWMTAEEAMRDLRKTGLITNRGQKAFRRWLQQGLPPTQNDSPLDWVIWAVWLWQMRPASILHQ
ncbi:hypothetical protein SAMN04244548_02983 [Paracoccus pantotrophus]|nr:hypothetical protein SAMN04244548_02983 [Paracoccus pantotrophus]